MSETGPRVLVLEGERASALAVVRALGRRGLRVDVGSTSERAIAACSRYCRTSFRYADPVRRRSDFVNGLLAHVRQGGYRLVVPMTENTVVPAMAGRAEIERFAAIAMSSNEGLEWTLRRSRGVSLAERLGIRVAAGCVVTTVAEACRAGERLGYPLVVACDRQNGEVGTGHIVTDEGECRSIVSSMVASRLGPLFVQRHVTGSLVGLGIAASRGEMLAAFQYREPHEIPDTGGGGSFRLSEAVSEALLSDAARVVRELAWDGMATFTFRSAGASTLHHLVGVRGCGDEWLPLALAAGLAVPWPGLDAPPRRESTARPYAVGLGRRELCGELRWLAHAIRSGGPGPSNGRRPKYGEVARSAVRLLVGKESVENLDIRDPWPAVRYLRDVLAQGTERLGRSWAQRREKRRAERLRRDPGRVVSRLRSAKSLLFVCSANAVRSVFAAEWTKHALEGSPLSIRSAGLKAWPGTSAHPLAVAEARLRGLDLTGHVAAVVTDDLVARADVILAMETAHLAAIRRRFPGVRDKSFLVTCLAEGVKVEIEDPVLQGEAAFSVCFDAISQALVPIIHAVSSAPPEARVEEAPGPRR